jgi:hypothetical protein
MLLRGRASLGQDGCLNDTCGQPGRVNNIDHSKVWRVGFTRCCDIYTRVENFEKKSLVWLLVAEEIPLLAVIEPSVIGRAEEFPPNLIAFHQIILANSGPVTNG